MIIILVREFIVHCLKLVNVFLPVKRLVKFANGDPGIPGDRQHLDCIFDRHLLQSRVEFLPKPEGFRRVPWGSRFIVTTHDTRSEFVKRTSMGCIPSILESLRLLFPSRFPFNSRKTRRCCEFTKWYRSGKERRPPARTAYKTLCVTIFFIHLWGKLFTIASGRRDDDFINPNHTVHEVCDDGFIAL